MTSIKCRVKKPEQENESGKEKQMKINTDKIMTVLKYIGKLALEILIIIGAADANKKKGSRR